MAILAALDFAAFESVLNILYVALGLGLVIFFHELGHFAVAKWCDVNVERFSIGFGPILWSWKKGETEYALSAIPFGGYVKMLGQDDMDPSQLTTEEIAQDPRSYSAKSVPQRMAIISAGVIMNVITGMLFFAVAFQQGVQTVSADVGTVQTGMPAWKAGIRAGDRITRIGDREVDSFADIMRGVALSQSDAIVVEGVHSDGREYKVTVHPDQSGTRRVIGVAPSGSLKLAEFRDSAAAPAQPGTPAARATPSFQQGDVIRQIGIPQDGGKVKIQPLEHFSQLQDALARGRDKKLEFYVQRKGAADDSLTKVTVPPQPFRSLGLWMDVGQITSIKAESPAAKAGLKVGDKITKVNGDDVGTQINSLHLPDQFAQLAGHEVEVRVKRQSEGGGSEEVTVRVRPDDIPGWIEQPISPSLPLSVPSIGIAFHLIPTVLKVQEGSPAAAAGIRPEEPVRKMELFVPEGAAPDGSTKTVTIEFDGKGGGKDNKDNWAYAFWEMQNYPQRNVRLTVSDRAGKMRTVELTPQPADDWFVPGPRGLVLQASLQDLKAENFAQAVQMGAAHTQNTVIDIYLTLRNLFAGDLSVKELHGPIGIATVAYKIATQGLAELLLFLGFLSANLAVLNFLPIPVLDGGHMVFLIWEGVTRKRPSERVVVAATYFGMAFVLGLMLLVIYLDIFVHGLGK